MNHATLATGRVLALTRTGLAPAGSDQLVLTHPPPSGRSLARLEQRNGNLETELRCVEQHNLNLVKEVIVLKEQLAEQPKRRGRQAEGSPP
jgi:hypothetical protein